MSRLNVDRMIRHRLGTRRLAGRERRREAARLRSLHPSQLVGVSIRRVLDGTQRREVR